MTVETNPQREALVSAVAEAERFVKRADPVIIVGVDPGVTTGIAIIECSLKRNRFKLVHRQDVLDVRDGAGLYDLFLTLKRLTRSSPIGAPVGGISMEQLMAYLASAQEKCEAQGAVRMAAHSESVPLFTYAPTSIRSTVVGSGRAKESDINMVTRQLTGLDRARKGEPSFSKHQQDALAAALCCGIREGWLNSLEPQEGVANGTEDAKSSVQ